MIKVRNIENIKDDDSITLERLTAFIPNTHSRAGNKINSLKSQSKKIIGNQQQQPYVSEDGERSLNSPHQLVSKMDNKIQHTLLPGYSELRHTPRRKQYRQSGMQLKQIITEQKIKIIVKNFVQKLTRNNINSQPVEYTPFYNDLERSILDTQGIQLHDYVYMAIAILSAIQIVILSIIYTLSIVFDEVNKMPVVQAFQSFSLLFYFLQLFVNCITVKFQEGKRLSTLRQIWNYYFKNNFSVDMISILILMLDLFTSLQITIYFRLFIIVKLSQGLDKIEKLQIFFIHNFYKLQYWSLIKVFIFNISFAHILAIFLVAMAAINQKENWMYTKDIYLAPWFERYAWSYYWATTMMLTVGFGDLAAHTYQQAIILTLIEMVSCMALAYNINCVGTLISNIRSQDLEKSKNSKIFRKLAKKNNVSQDLQWRINNYIEQSSNIKKKFNYEQQNIFVQKLPKGLKVEFLKESNKKIFQNLPFFKNLMERTLFSFAEKIQMHVCHPEQIIQHIDDPHHLLILKDGQIGFTCKKSGCDFNSTIIDQLKNTNAAEPTLISLGFIRKSRSLYEIKSLEYSILYFLDHDNILNILRGSQMDYELFCLLRDKCSHIPDQYELFKCEICTGRHTKFLCPKLHFIPIKQHVTNRYFHRFKTGKSKRESQFYRFQNERYSALKIFLELNQDQSTPSNVLKSKKSQPKPQNNILNQRKKFQAIDEVSGSITKQLSDFKDFFSKNTAELIKNEINKALLHGQAQDQVWLIEADRMKNYKNYFQLDNSCNLTDKFSVEKRVQNCINKDDFWSQIRSKHQFSSNDGTKHQIQEGEKHKSTKFSLETLRNISNNKN